jgi:uncharacterized membrane protein YkvA (DUF1232 family)
MKPVRTKWIPTAKTFYHACRNPETPFGVKVVAVLLCLYALNPFDLVSDLIPVLGWLDDATILGIGFYLLSKFIPKRVWQSAKAKVQGVTPPL